MRHAGSILAEVLDVFRAELRPGHHDRSTWTASPRR